MQCIAHPTRAASNICDKCNHWLCDDCVVDANGRQLCKSCVNAMALESGNLPVEPASHVTHVAPPGNVRVPHDPIYGLPHRRVNWGLLFLFSVFFPPGANYMYMGLVKRGLAAMCGFFLIVYLTATAFTSALTIFFALSIPVFWITCFFDGFHIRRRINYGEPVQDGVGNILNAIFRNKVISAILLVVIAIALAGNFLGVAVDILRRAVPIILLVLALYIIFRKKSNDRA